MSVAGISVVGALEGCSSHGDFGRGSGRVPSSRSGISSVAVDSLGASSVMPVDSTAGPKRTRGVLEKPNLGCEFGGEREDDGEVEEAGRSLDRVLFHERADEEADHHAEGHEADREVRREGTRAQKRRELRGRFPRVAAEYR